MKSATLRLSSPMIALLEEHKITRATPVQIEIIPAVLDGRDVITQSETGSGKTLSFAIPIIERMNRRDGLRALVLAPTRELAVQIASEFTKFSRGKHLGVTAVYGGVSIHNQRKKLEKTNIVVATPGRLLDLMERQMIDLGTVNTLVLDEADRMLDMGFIRDIEKIMKKIPSPRQTLLFSATMVPAIVQMSSKYLRDPKKVILAPKETAVQLHQTYYQIAAEQKTPFLAHLLSKDRELAIVFCNRKHLTDRLARQLGKFGVAAKCLNGNMSQSQRERTTEDFRHKKFTVLVATDVAARGLHIDDISHVYNFEIPRDVESYTHRVGRTARAGKKGEAISLLSTGEEKKFFQQILFHYKGSITMKSASDVAYVPIAVDPSKQISPKSEAKAHPASRIPGRRGEREKGAHSSAAGPKKPPSPWRNRR